MNPKTACAVVRLDEIEEREWISTLILKVLLYASVLESVQALTVCLCGISKGWKNERASPVTPATSVIHVSHMT